MEEELLKPKRKRRTKAEMEAARKKTADLNVEELMAPTPPTDTKASAGGLLRVEQSYVNVSWQTDAMGRPISLRVAESEAQQMVDEIKAKAEKYGRVFTKQIEIEH